MERYEIEVFLALADELHFGRTAERLRISQGRVSQTVKALERRFDVLLFERTSRRVGLTPVGERLRDDLLPAQRLIHQAIARVTAAGRGVSGILRIGYSSPMAAHLLLRTITAFRRTYPDCEVTIQEIQLSDPYGPLREEAVELQVSELPVIEPDLVCGPPVFSSTGALIVPASHSLAAQGSATLEDLAQETLLVVGGAAPEHWLDFYYPRHTPSGSPIRRGHSAISWHEIPLLVAAGEGVSIACSDAAPHHNTPGVTWIPLQDAVAFQYAPIWRKQGETARVRAFTEQLHRTVQTTAATN
ncbi:LysR family transcriptional regulator [Streptomyces sp. SAS_281]|uniref:LysR family transcriptional regulator n=1 Tax=Streptomyces sp. SAS_281 TaxID=3412744 RepID=UPI00403C1231